jgi:hypothetical protein
MPATRDICSDCRVSGECGPCFGTGVNTHLNSDEPKCPNGKGTGVCPECGGSGSSRPTSGSGLTILDLD